MTGAPTASATTARASRVEPDHRPGAARDCTSAPGACRTSVSWQRPSDRVLARESGQASVELVAVIPLVVTVGFVVFSFMAAAAAEELAAQAAKAGAIALLQDRDPTEAARAALPGGSRRAALVSVDGRRVTVRIRPRGPIGPINDRLTARAAANAGPEPE
jgi:Flp pilus assembly protein TadG